MRPGCGLNGRALLAKGRRAMGHNACLGPSQDPARTSIFELAGSATIAAARDCAGRRRSCGRNRACGAFVDFRSFAEKPRRKCSLTHFEVGRKSPQVRSQTFNAHPRIFAHHVNLENLLRVMDQQGCVVSFCESAALFTFLSFQHPQTHRLRISAFPFFNSMIELSWRKTKRYWMNAGTS